MSSKFAKGDVVQLRSGGPKMTVEKVIEAPRRDEELLVCQWFSGSKLQNGSFRPESLVKVEESNE